MTLFQGQVCVDKVDAMHDGDQRGHTPMLCHLLVHLGCTDGVDSHSTFKRLGVRFGQQRCIAFNCGYPKLPAPIGGILLQEPMLAMV